MNLYDIDLSDLPTIITLPTPSSLESFRAIADEVIYANSLEKRPHDISITLINSSDRHSTYLIENKQ